MTTPYYFQVGYLKLGVATAPSDTPTINIINLADGALLVTGASVTKQGNMAGLCTYVYNGAANLNLIGLVHSTDATVDGPDLHSIGVISLAGSTNSDSPGVTTMLENYARRTGDYSVLTAEQVWTYVTRTITSGGITVAEIFDYLVGNIVTANSIGKLLKDMLNATVGSRATPADVHTSVSISSTVAESVSRGNLAIQTYHTFRQAITSTVLNDLSAATKLWLSIKNNEADDDDESIIYLEKTAGLTRVDGQEYKTSSNGSLTVSGSSGDWSVAIYLHASVAGLLDDNYAGSSKPMELKALIGDDTVSACNGMCDISAGLVKAIA